MYLTVFLYKKILLLEVGQNLISLDIVHMYSIYSTFQELRGNLLIMDVIYLWF
jgi:hypothetical protein